MPNTQFKSLLFDKWWLLFLRGALGVLFGIAAFLWPFLALFSIVIVYGAFIAADGALALGASVGAGQAGSGSPAWRANRWWLALLGLIGLVAGLIMLFNPVLAASVVIAFVGIWSIFRGIIELVWYVKLKAGMEHGKWILLDAAISLIFGILILNWPTAAAVALTWGLGAFALATGILQMAFALKLKNAGL